MKVILLQDVAKVGRKWEVVNVPDGHALNMLIPKRWAEPASSANLKRLESKKGVMTASAAEREAIVAAAHDALKEGSTKIEVEANEQGHMFAAVKPEVIVAALGNRLGSSMVAIKEPIKSTGEHTVYLQNGKEEFPIVIELVSKG